MKQKRLEQILRIAVDCEKRAESQEEYELWHGIYLDAQNYYKSQKGRYAKIREYKPDFEKNIERMEGRA